MQSTLLAKSRFPCICLLGIIFTLLATACGTVICGLSGGSKRVKVIDEQGIVIRGVQVSTASPAQPSRMNSTDVNGVVVILKSPIVKFRAVGYEVAAFNYDDIRDTVTLKHSQNQTPYLPEW